jgi:hypothetical protein
MQTEAHVLHFAQLGIRKLRGHAAALDEAPQLLLDADLPPLELSVHLLHALSPLVLRERPWRLLRKPPAVYQRIQLLQLPRLWPPAPPTPADE